MKICLIYKIDSENQTGSGIETSRNRWTLAVSFCLKIINCKRANKKMKISKLLKLTSSKLIFSIISNNYKSEDFVYLLLGHRLLQLQDLTIPISIVEI